MKLEKPNITIKQISEPRVAIVVKTHSKLDIAAIKVDNCCNPNIGFTTKCEVQGLMRRRVCLGVKHTLTNGGECKG